MLILSTQAISGYTDFLAHLAALVVDYLPRLLGAILAYIVGTVLIRWISSVVRRALMARDFDPSLQSFLASLIRMSLIILLLLFVFSILGVNMTSFAAILAGLAVGVGAALNGTLGNFAGGVMMLIFKPFKLGDQIEAQGFTGRVIEQGIFNTYLLSNENKTIILANGALSTGTIVNLTSFGNLRVEILMPLNLNNDFEKAKKIALSATRTVEKVLSDPPAEFQILRFSENSATIAVRPFCKEDDYWLVYFETQKKVKEAFDENQITFPLTENKIQIVPLPKGS
ncbi:MAG: mechanosensitive ion channel [Saprospiraceae bacterium]|nr:mechanosensitive ion channel [Candidatus Vicinibacter proximus]MBL7824717.1 mechanosensitive ion channel [Saprospiraceae bacterium]MCC6843961.1 mechanosensitive ion channel [Saprospiraceae bacterium]HRG32379.1 mechanosensitive ion channel [Saprospiraceae bacterium]